MDGQWDFTAIVGGRVRDCVLGHLCSQCGKPLGWWMAFVGGPVSANTGCYSDPPMHEECARAALQLCPHITRATMKRAKVGAIKEDRMAPNPHAIFSRTTVWVLTITRGYEILEERGVAPIFRTRTIKRRHGWRNREDGPGLVPLSADELAAAMEEANERLREGGPL
jgi:hypothetical protein